MATIGDSFFFRVSHAHLWVVITNPDGPDRDFVMVNIETDSGQGEGACILQPEDDGGSFITDPSEVRYKDALLWRETGPNGHNALKASGLIRPYGMLKAATLVKIGQNSRRRVQIGTFPLFREASLPSR